MAQLTETYPRYAMLPAGVSQGSALNTQLNSPTSAAMRVVDNLEMTQALVILGQLTSWVDALVVHDALAMTSQLALLVREAAAYTSVANGHLEWRDWCGEE
ncbi:hypothetical protein QQZ08_001292 [Neonectria magnoliae]|uniref:Uncharacterized protein n=1 Tax=Neonectria magnoliae TaxID=2732573 RepID=A0ABR1IGT5_9HYPO